MLPHAPTKRAAETGIPEDQATQCWARVYRRRFRRQEKENQVGIRRRGTSKERTGGREDKRFEFCYFQANALLPCGFACAKPAFVWRWSQGTREGRGRGVADGIEILVEFRCRRAKGQREGERRGRGGLGKEECRGERGEDVLGYAPYSIHYYIATHPVHLIQRVLRDLSRRTKGAGGARPRRVRGVRGYKRWAALGARRRARGWRAGDRRI
ncbi:hypothetical protein B0H16DRAFT_1700533 [Mycena metata]|uniref:Uncharacterized protein n=1 Tax=Mycena metata TaxID=1033252 RepID=A0AAD7MIY2_9AGAR|nr:hypothetical protein B0H16DRAFT_1700533 [Mycena metata]